MSVRGRGRGRGSKRGRGRGRGRRGGGRGSFQNIRGRGRRRKPAVQKEAKLTQNASLDPMYFYSQAICYIIPFGTKCHTAWCLKESRMKKCSYPFDWSNSTPKVILSILQDDFETLLDQTQFVDMEHPWKEDHNHCGHKIYGENMFPHRDFRRTENYRYLQRCVQRFRAVLEKPDPKIFLITFLNASRNRGDGLEDELNEIVSILDERTTNFRLVAILHEKGTYESSVQHEGLVTYLYITTKTKSDDVKFYKPKCNRFFLQTLRGLGRYKLKNDVTALSGTKDNIFAW